MELLAIEEKKLEIEERKTRLAREKQAMESQKLTDELNMITLGEKQMQLTQKTDNKKRGARDQKDADEANKRIQDSCNHHCGGNSGVDIKNGRGYEKAVSSVGAMKHMDGTIVIHCSRCHKEWSSKYPKGNDGANKDKIYGVWSQGVELYQNSGINGPRTMMVIGGTKYTQLPTAS